MNVEEISTAVEERQALAKRRSWGFLPSRSSRLRVRLLFHAYDTKTQRKDGSREDAKETR